MIDSVTGCLTLLRVYKFDLLYFMFYHGDFGIECTIDEVQKVVINNNDDNELLSAPVQVSCCTGHCAVYIHVQCASVTYIIECYCSFLFFFNFWLLAAASSFLFCLASFLDLRAESACLSVSSRALFALSMVMSAARRAW